MKSPFSYDTLRQVIVEQQEEILKQKQMRLVERDKIKEVLDVIDKNSIKVIISGRNVGKSILAHQALRDKQYGYINFDDERLIGLTSGDLNKNFAIPHRVKSKFKGSFFLMRFKMSMGGSSLSIGCKDKDITL